MVATMHKKMVIDMLIQSFAHNDRISTMLKSRHPRHLKAFFEYIYELIERRGRFFLSDNYSTLLLYYQKSQQKPSIGKTLANLKLLIHHLSWNRLWQTVRLSNRIKTIREAEAQKIGDQDYIYVWFLAGKENKHNYAGLYESMEHLKVESIMQGLPIYIETTVPRMVPIYERAGFKCYKQAGLGGQQIWFLKYGRNE